MGKPKKYLFSLLKVILFIVLFYTIYIQLQEKNISIDDVKDIFNSIETKDFIFLFLAVLLMPTNWSLEAYKWKTLVKNILPNYGFLTSIKGVLMGVFFGFLTPNRIGEFGGRLYKIDKGFRIKALNLAFWGGVAQFLVTSLSGISLGILNFEIIDKYKLVIPFLAILLLITYFNLKSIVKFFTSIKGLKDLSEKYLFDFQLSNFVLSKVLLITCLRYFIYVNQYILLFYFFGVEVNYLIMFSIVSSMLLFQTIAPSFALIDLGVRGSVLLFLFGKYTDNQLNILFVVLLVWILNLVVPAVIGYYNFTKIKMEDNYEKLTNNIDNAI